MVTVTTLKAGADVIVGAIIAGVDDDLVKQIVLTTDRRWLRKRKRIVVSMIELSV